MFRKRVSLIIEMPKGILVVKHIFPRTWGLPGGGIKFGESAEDAARRELFEELGLKATKIKHLFDFNYRLHRHFVFLVEARGKIKLNWEIIDYNYSRNVKLRGYSKKIIDRYFLEKDF